MGWTKSFSFVVGSKYGPRSPKYIVTVNEKHDVFVTTAAQSGLWHITLHASGRWHLRRHGFDEPANLKSHKNAVPAHKYKVGLRIIVLDSCLFPALDVDAASKPDVWLERPPYGGSTEISIMDWDPSQPQLQDWPGRVFGAPAPNEDWPGKGWGTEIVKHFEYENEPRSVFVVLRHLPAEHRVTVDMEAKKPPKSSAIARNLVNRQLTRFGVMDAGFLYVVDFFIAT